MYPSFFLTRFRHGLTESIHPSCKKTTNGVYNLQVHFVKINASRAMLKIEYKWCVHKLVAGSFLVSRLLPRFLSMKGTWERMAEVVQSSISMRSFGGKMRGGVRGQVVRFILYAYEVPKQGPLATHAKASLPAAEDNVVSALGQSFLLALVSPCSSMLGGARKI